jgi:hypothetical protein
MEDADGEVITTSPLYSFPGFDQAAHEVAVQWVLYVHERLRSVDQLLKLSRASRACFNAVTVALSIAWVAPPVS